MNEDEIGDIFGSELKNADGRVNISTTLETAKQSIKPPYWHTNRTVRIVNRLYSQLKTHQQSIISHEKRELDSLAERQNEKRKELSCRIETLIGGDKDNIGGTEFIRRFVARRHRIARDMTSKNLSSALDKLSQNVYSSSFDPWSAEAVIASDDRKVIRKYASEFAWHLICKGWSTADLDDLTRRMKNSSYSIPVFVALTATQDRHSFRFLLSLPNIKIELDGPQYLPDGATVLYPSDYLKLHDLYKYYEVDLPTCNLISDMLEENPVIALSVDAYARREATQEALSTANDVLDAISYAHQNADLGHLEYIGPSKRIRWNRSLDSPPLHGMSYGRGFPGILDSNRINVAYVFTPRTQQRVQPELVKSSRCFGRFA